MCRANLFLVILVPVLLTACRRGPEIATGTTPNARVEAAGFHGQSYQTRDSRSAITLISADELEYRTGDTTLLCKYTDQGTALRVIVTMLGTQQVMYFRRVANGLTSNDGDLFLNSAGLAELRQREEIERQQRMEAQASAERERLERERVNAIAAAEEAQRQAEQKRVADEVARQQAEANRRETLKAVESASCTEGEYNVPSRSELVFTLSAQRECWTPWLLPENRYGWGIKETGDVLLQLMYADGTLGKQFEDGPGKHWSDNNLARAVRFKSLKKEAVKISFNIR